MSGTELKIVHVLHSFGTGGMEKGVATLVANATANFEHVIVCLTETGDSTRLLPPNTRIIAMNKPSGNSLVFLWQLSKILQNLKPHVVHTRNWGGTDGILAARLAGIKAIVHSEHGFGPENPKGDLKKRIWIHRLISPCVREYICLSKALTKWALNRAKLRKRVTQIYNGVDTNQFCPGSGAKVRETLGISSNAFVVGIVATLNTIKDHPTLIKAFKTFHQKVPESFLIIAGDGPERKKLEKLSSPGVRFLGNRKNIPDIMRTLDVFVLSSINEGISNTILEAMATGLPVVATRVGGNVELVDDHSTGYLFPVSDSGLLCSILLRYAHSASLRSKHGKAGRDKVVRFFSVGAMVKNYEKVWKRVARPLKQSKVDKNPVPKKI